MEVLPHETELIATIAVGYADGFPRSSATNGQAGTRVLEVNGRLAPVVGRVTMRA